MKDSGRNRRREPPVSPWISNVPRNFPEIALPLSAGREKQGAYAPRSPVRAGALTSPDQLPFSSLEKSSIFSQLLRPGRDAPAVERRRLGTPGCAGPDEPTNDFDAASTKTRVWGTETYPTLLKVQGDPSAASFSGQVVGSYYYAGA
jgi:hypothetical protein